MFDFQSLKNSIEQADASKLAAFYGDGAELQVVDRQRPPGAPLTLHGKGEIEKFWQDICSRSMTHHVEHEVIGDDRIAFVEECQYPDGCRVMAASVLDLEDGKIMRHVTVQAWDETPAGEAPAAMH